MSVFEPLEVLGGKLNVGQGDIVRDFRIYALNCMREILLQTEFDENIRGGDYEYASTKLPFFDEAEEAMLQSCKKLWFNTSVLAC